MAVFGFEDIYRDKCKEFLPDALARRIYDTLGPSALDVVCGAIADAYDEGYNMGYDEGYDEAAMDCDEEELYEEE